MALSVNVDNLIKIRNGVMPKSVAEKRVEGTKNVPRSFEGRFLKKISPLVW